MSKGKTSMEAEDRQGTPLRGASTSEMHMSSCCKLTPRAHHRRACADMGYLTSDGGGEFQSKSSMNARRGSSVGKPGVGSARSSGPEPRVPRTAEDGVGANEGQQLSVWGRVSGCSIA